MQTNESCRCCEKMVVTFESYKPFDMLMELPHTMDSTERHYAWKHHTMMTYAMIPQSIHGTTGIVDLYVCMDEDDLDDIDLRGLATEFLNRAVLPGMNSIREMRLSQPVMTAPAAIGCWKLHHHQMEEIS